MARWSMAALALLAACAGEARTDPQRPGAVEPVDEPANELPAASADEPEPVAEAAEPAGPDFTSPLPETPCPDAPRVALAHVERALPGALRHAVALRSEDGRRIRVAIADAPITQDGRGRFEGPAARGARFEMDALRTRRGALDARVLGPPDAPRGALTHVRVVTPEARLTFGHRDVGRVELTEVSAERVCGRIELDDGFTRVRGAFVAPVAGPLPL